MNEEDVLKSASKDLIDEEDRFKNLSPGIKEEFIRVGIITDLGAFLLSNK